MENLKVGQSFEVVEITEGWYGKTFKVGGHTIKSLGDGWNHTLANGEDWDYADKKVDLNFNHGLWLTGSEVKPIGKLTITKLK